MHHCCWWLQLLTHPLSPWTGDTPGSGPGWNKLGQVWKTSSANKTLESTPKWSRTISVSRDTGVLIHLPEACLCLGDRKELVLSASKILLKKVRLMNKGSCKMGLGMKRFLKYWWDLICQMGNKLFSLLVEVKNTEESNYSQKESASS